MSYKPLRYLVVAAGLSNCNESLRLVCQQVWWHSCDNNKAGAETCTYGELLICLIESICMYGEFQVVDFGRDTASLGAWESERERGLRISKRKGSRATMRETKRGGRERERYGPIDQVRVTSLRASKFTQSVGGWSHSHRETPTNPCWLTLGILAPSTHHDRIRIYINSNLLYTIPTSL